MEAILLNVCQLIPMFAVESFFVFIGAVVGFWFRRTVDNVVGEVVPYVAGGSEVGRDELVEEITDDDWGLVAQ